MKVFFYLRAHKDNKVGNFNKSTYYERINTVINNGNSVNLTKKALVKIIPELGKLLNKCDKVVTLDLKLKHLNSNILFS